ncbi:MAG: hypothetical protein PF444_06435, partial [Bacteroidales bacterium]|nr:hypothetical protein [Bacteroidales bacterium]
MTKKVTKKVAKKVDKKAVAKKVASKKVTKKVAKKTAKKTTKKTVKKSNTLSHDMTKEQIFLPEQRKHELRSPYNSADNTYRGLKLVWANIQQFQIFFLEAQYKLTDAEYNMMLFEKQTFSNLIDKAKDIKEIQLKKLKAVEELKETYKIVWAIRRKIYTDYKQSDVIRAEIDRVCKDDPVLWINYFAWTFDPRLTNVGLPAKLPFVLYPAQVKVIEKVDHCYRNNRNFVIEKSRAEGLTEMLCAYDVWRFLYTPGYKAGWGSRVMSLVDQIGNQDTIFEKLRRIIYATPKEMRPTGWKNKNGNKFDNSMRLVNPDNG